MSDILLKNGGANASVILTKRHDGRFVASLSIIKSGSVDTHSPDSFGSISAAFQWMANKAKEHGFSDSELDVQVVVNDPPKRAYRLDRSAGAMAHAQVEKRLV